MRNKRIKPVFFALKWINIRFIFAYIRFEPNIAAHPSWAAKQRYPHCPNSRKEGHFHEDGPVEFPVLVIAVEGLYCKRPILCLASSKILTAPLTARLYPPAFGAGGGHTRCVERGWGVNILEDARHCSVLYICKYLEASKSSCLKAEKISMVVCLWICWSGAFSGTWCLLPMRITIYFTLHYNNLFSKIISVQFLHIILYLLQFLQFQYSHLTPPRRLHIEDDIQDCRFSAENRNTLSLQAIFRYTLFLLHIHIYVLVTIPHKTKPPK